MGEQLTEARRKILGLASGSIGVISMPYRTGFEAAAWRKNALWLVDAGLIEPSPHGDWYITDAGRATLAHPSHQAASAAASNKTSSTKEADPS